jgi:hypothetical protein
MATELERFAEAFPLEDDLRKHIATLLTKMHTQGVQITHGPQEYGKDIVFYAPDAFGNWTLQACVIKNAKISGSVDDNDGARNVLFQIEQALDTPFINSSGADEHVSRVYVMSPYECSQISMRSIQGKLRTRSGQTEFLCGNSLLAKFAQDWPEFLFFESTLLGSYVADLQKAFDETDPISFLASQHNIFAHAGIEWRNVYVRQMFETQLQQFDLLVGVPDLGMLDTLLDQARLMNFIEQIHFAAEFIQQSEVWDSGDQEKANQLSTSLEWIASEAKGKWEAAWQKNRAEREREGKSAVPRNAARLMIQELNWEQMNDVIGRTKELIENFELAVRLANGLVDHAKGRNVTLGDGEYLNYCRIREVVKLLPQMFRKKGKPLHNRYTENLLDQTSAPLLITGPAGYGKTSFCKWNVLNDVKALLEKRSTTIPVYVPLHQLATIQLSNSDEVFFRTTELQQLMSTARKSRQKLRLYLDGLDEISTPERQRLLMDLAARLRLEWPAIQIIVTGRDYVSGPWLRWLSRVSLSELSEDQVAELALNWLDRDPAILSDFQQQLASARTLKPLMRVPLLGTLIIAVFKKLRSLPEGRVKLYEIFVELMCGGWDIAKNVKREIRFGSRPKLSVLTRLAGILHLNSKREAQESDIRTALSQTMPSLLDQWRNLLDELLEDGLLIRIGPNLAFSHLSFQEYLVATDLTDPSGGRQQHVLKSFLCGEDWWREVLSFYLAMSTRPDEAETWIWRTMEKLSSGDRIYDLSQRYDFLISRLKEAWPGWSPRQHAQNS